ncbi:uroporphyrinogen decarboxylase family protein [Thermodesulfobacteriota bacterium]
MDKIGETLQTWCSGQNVNFIDENAEEAYKKRAQRVSDVIQLKVPDRVPVTPSFGMFPALDNGFTVEDVMFDYAKATQAWIKTLKDFEPDLYRASSYAFPGPVFEALDYKLLKLPGRGIPSNHVFQFDEKEYITAEEFYDAFLSDPSDFMFRVYLPRVCGALEPLKILPPFSTWFGYYLGIVGNVSLFGMPEITGAFEALKKAGEEALKWRKNVGAETQQIASMGFPDIIGGHSAAPFDIVGDWFRGTRGIMLDMYRHPDKLLEVMEKLVPIQISMGANLSKRMGKPVVMLMLHKGLESFMSDEQFKTFYWPTLRKVLIGLMDEGLVPMPLFEGEYTSRLEIIKDIPKGKAIYWFEKVDINKAKEILGDTVCFRGNVPGSLLQLGTPEEVKEYVKELIDVVGKNGGLIVDCDIWFDEAKHENVKAMVDTTKTYGVY